MYMRQMLHCIFLACDWITNHLLCNAYIVLLYMQNRKLKHTLKSQLWFGYKVYKLDTNTLEKTGAVGATDAVLTQAAQMAQSCK